MTARRSPATALLGALLLGYACSPALAQQTRQLTPIAAAPAAPAAPAPPQTPFLRIDAGFHTQVVNRFAQDRNGRIIATVSDDKTIRIWNASDGAPLGTLRVPVAPGDEGALFAVAISPDGKTLLAGGYTGYTWDKLFAVYIFDLEGLKLKARLPNLPGPVNDLAYAPDGHSFAVAMGNGGGVWLVDAHSGSTIGSDGAWHDAVTSVKFDARGRLYATGFDGDVRLYDANLRRLASRVPVRGGHPYSLAVSPDGRLVAVGYGDQPRVEILNAADLSTRLALDTDPAGRRITGGAGLGAVAWGVDGGLFAAGSLRGADGLNVVRHWNGGVGRPADAPGLTDTAFQIAGTADGGVILVGADPALERLDHTGHVVFRKDSPGLDFRDMGDRLFRVSADGLSVQLQTKAMRETWTADLGQRRIGPPNTTRGLTPIAAPQANTAHPIHATIAPPGAAPPEVSNWRNSTAPRIAGQQVALDPDEVSRSYAAAPTGQLVVLGTDYRLRVYRRDGSPAGQAELPGPAWAVGVSGDSHVVVAAVGDGTLRWFGLDADGQLTPRVALFASADSRWVAWTPTGYFDYADTGGSEGMVGVLLNRARAQAPDWYSFAQVYRQFYAPDAVAAQLRGSTQLATRASSSPISGGGGITQVRQTIQQSPPPDIELAAICWAATAGRTCRQLAATNVTRSLTVIAAAADDPAAGAPANDANLPANIDRVVLQYRLRGREATSSAVDLFVNGHNDGRAVRQLASGGEAVFEQPAAVDAGANTLQLRAYDPQGQTYAQSRTMQVFRAAPAQAKPAKPTLFMLSVGINGYTKKVTQLHYSVADARSVAEAFKRDLPSSYDHIELTELFDDQGSKDAVLKAMADIAAKATARDTVLIYLSGHGVTIDGHYYYITQNVPSAVVTDITANAVGENALVEALAAVKASNTMLFLDTCHAGAFSLASMGNLAHESGRYVLAGAASVEEALDSYDDHNGVFAAAVLRGLSGKAADGGGTVTNFQLGFFVQPLVRQLATEVDPDHTQSAEFKIEAENAVPFPIATVQPTP